MTGMNTLMLLYLHTGTKNCSTAICYDNNMKRYRTSRHDSSKYTPFQLLYKREARLPVVLNFLPRKQDDNNGDDMSM